MEFPHLIRLVENNQFDTIYHEHFSYLSFGTVRQIFASQGLEIFDVEELPTHGGSLRIFAKHQDDRTNAITENVSRLLTTEEEHGLRSYVVDANPNKQQKYLPGSHVPVVHEDVLKSDKPEFVIILPWNLKDEIMEQLSYIRGWGGKFVIPIPTFHII